MTTQESLAPETLVVLESARQIAIERGYAKVYPDVLLVALSETPGRAAAVLSMLGVDSAGLRSWLDEAIGTPRLSSRFEDDAPHSLRTLAVLSAAAAESHDRGGVEIAPEDVLAGILREPQAERGVAARMLLDKGIDLQGLRATVSLVKRS